MDIWVSVLKYLHQKQTSHDKHKGSICSRKTNFVCKKNHISYCVSVLKALNLLVVELLPVAFGPGINLKRVVENLIVEVCLQ